MWESKRSLDISLRGKQLAQHHVLLELFRHAQLLFRVPGGFKAKALRVAVGSTPLDESGASTGEPKSFWMTILTEVQCPCADECCSILRKSGASLGERRVHHALRGLR